MCFADESGVGVCEPGQTCGGTARRLMAVLMHQLVHPRSAFNAFFSPHFGPLRHMEGFTL